MASSTADQQFLPPGGVMRQAEARAYASRWERIAYFCLLGGMFTLTWNIVRLSDVNLSLSDGLFLFVIMFLAARGHLNVQPFGSATPIWYIGLLLMLGGLLISSIVNGVAVRWVSVAAQYAFAFLAIPMMLASWRRQVLDRCIVAFALGVVLSQGIAFGANLFFTYHDTWMVVGRDFITATGRVGALSGNPNTNGAVATFCLLSLIYIFHQGLLPRWLVLLCAAFAAWGLIASASFTSFVLACIALPLASLILWPRGTLVGLLVVLFAVAVGVTSEVPLPAVFEQRVAEALAQGNLDQAGTFSGRWEMALEAWRLSGDTALIGFGADGYRSVSAHQAPVHVLPLLLMTEGGLPSLLGLLVLLIMLWVLGFSILRSVRGDAALVLGLLVVFTGFTLSVPHMYARMWIVPLLLGLVHALKWREQIPKPLWGGPPPSDAANIPPQLPGEDTFATRGAREP
ncbi:MAG: hypothetical protein KJO02_09270 [Erythrobacter sp.]|nr:hypothetical protein [Erythrobacter sp.]